MNYAMQCITSLLPIQSKTALHLMWRAVYYLLPKGVELLSVINDEPLQGKQEPRS